MKKIISSDSVSVPQRLLICALLFANVFTLIDKIVAEESISHVCKH